MTKSLKPCPFCGHSPNPVHWFRDGFGIECSSPYYKCHGALYGYDTEQEAVKAWNTRPITDIRKEPKNYE